MRIKATGPGRTGTLDQGVSKLELRAEESFESKQLQALFEELRNNIGFWSPIMFAVKRRHISRTNEKALTSIVRRVQTKFEAFLDGVDE